MNAIAYLLLAFFSKGKLTESMHLSCCLSCAYRVSYANFIQCVHQLDEQLSVTQVCHEALEFCSICASVFVRQHLFSCEGTVCV